MSTSNFVRQPENVTCQPGPFWVPCLCALLFVVCGERTVWAFASGLGDDCTINAETRENPSPAFAIPEQEVIATIGATYDDPTEHEECMIAKRTFKWRIVEVLVRSYSSSDFVPSTYRPELDHPSTSDPNATITGKFPQPGKWRVRLELTANWQGTAGCGSCGCGPDELEVWFNVVGVKMQSLTYNSDQGVLKDKNDDYEAGGHHIRTTRMAAISRRDCAILSNQPYEEFTSRGHPCGRIRVRANPGHECDRHS